MFKKEDRTPSGREQSWQEPQRPAAPAPAPAPRPSPAPSAGAEQSVISARLKVVGNLESDDDIQVRGRVEGDISCRTLIVAEGATVDGAISADSVEIMGTIKGRIDAERVRIAGTGHMDGDIAYQILAMEEGAVLDGQVHRRSPPKSSAASAPAPAASAGSGGGAASSGGTSSGGTSTSGEAKLSMVGTGGKSADAGKSAG